MTEEPPIIVRPSGVWNSRAPLNNYIQELRAIHRTKSILTLSIYALRHDARNSPDISRSGRQFLKRITKHEAVAGEAWLDYRKSFPRTGPNGPHPQPTISDLAGDTILALYDIRETSVVRLASLFEAYSQCWALNFLAGRLEAGLGLTARERRLADAFNPLSGNRPAPGWPQIVEAFPALESELKSLPHLFHHPETREPMAQPFSENLNALTVIFFWRAYRNLSVHAGRLVTTKFYTKYRLFFSEMMRGLDHIERLERGRRLPLHDDMFASMAAVQFRCVMWMN